MAGWPTVIIMLLSPPGDWAWAELGKSGKSPKEGKRVSAKNNPKFKFFFQIFRFVPNVNVE